VSNNIHKAIVLKLSLTTIRLMHYRCWDGRKKRKKADATSRQLRFRHIFFAPLTEVPTIPAKKTINRRHCDNDDNEEGNTKGFHFLKKREGKRLTAYHNKKLE
jgi:hypothetical protein